MGVDFGSLGRHFSCRTNEKREHLVFPFREKGEGRMFRITRGYYVVGSLCLLALPQYVYGASYEVVPTIIAYQVKQDIYDYWANVYDNTAGATYRCTVQYSAGRVGAPLVQSQCYDLTKNLKSVLPPSSDIVTIAQPTQTTPSSSPYAGIWQIDSKTGDLQFCLSTDSLNLPTNGCVKLNWRGAPPD
jgi:hypothetical protein